MDGLSAAATVIQLIQVTTQVATALTQFAASFKDAETIRGRLADHIALMRTAETAMKSILQKSSPSLRSPELNNLLDRWSNSDGAPMRYKKELEKVLVELEAAGKRRMGWGDRFKWPMKEKKIKEVIRSFEEYMPYFQAILALDTSELLRGIANEREQIRDDMMTIRQSDLSRSILQWLDGVNCTVKHELVRKQRQETTGEWFFTLRQYIDWRDGLTNFVWLDGKRAGKSVLASAVIDALENGLAHGEALASFYFDFRDSRTMTTMELLRSLITQFLWDVKTDWLSSFPEFVARRDRGVGPPTDLHMLLDFLRRAAGLHERPIIVIDGLDECDDLSNLLDVVGKLNDGRNRLFVSSRTLVDIKKSFSGLPSIHLGDMVEAVGHDMRLHIDKELQSRNRLQTLRGDVQEEIRVALMQKADGMFRWVQCQLDRLNECWCTSDIREVLDTLPSTLYETYERILRAIDAKKFDSQVARRALMWLLTVSRPLTLTQLAEALAIDRDKSVMNRDIVPMSNIGIINVCGSLVNFDEKSDVVSLSHYSVKEYLTSCETSSKYFVSLPHANLEVMSLLIHYMILINDHSNTAPNPLYHYVLFGGFRHLANIPEDDSILPLLITFEKHIEANFEKYAGLPRTGWLLYRKPLLALYIIITFAPPWLLEMYLCHHPIQVQATDKEHPLIYAAQRSVKHVQMLLDAVDGGCDLNQEYRCSNSHVPYMLPLAAASRNPRHDQQEELIRFFLARGSQVPANIIHTALRLSYELCDPAIISILLQSGADATVLAWSGNTCLHALLAQSHPSEGDCLEIARLLVEAGCDDNSLNDDGLSPLHLSLQNGHVSVTRWLIGMGLPIPPDAMLHISVGWPDSSAIVRLLLEYDVAIDVQDDQGNTPLHILQSNWSDSDNLEAAHMLVRRGCRLDTQNRAGLTPLHLAAERGRWAILEFHVDCGGTLPADIINSAVKSIACDMLRLRRLLTYGADVRARAGNGDTALHSLSCRPIYGSGIDMDCLELAVFLVENGCDVQATNSSGVTPLHLAVQHGRLLVVQYLLDKGAQVPSDIVLVAACQDMHANHHLKEILQVLSPHINSTSIPLDAGCNSPLHLLLELDNIEDVTLERAQLLQQAGYDLTKCVNIANTQGRIPLHAVLSKASCWTKVTSYLLELGAKFSHVDHLFLDNFFWATNLPWYPDVISACQASAAKRCVTADHVIQVRQLLGHHFQLSQSVTDRILDVAGYWVCKSTIRKSFSCSNVRPLQTYSLPTTTGDRQKWVLRRVVFSLKSSDARPMNQIIQLLVQRSSGLHLVPCFLRIKDQVPSRTAFAIWDEHSRLPSWLPSSWTTRRQLALKDLKEGDTLALEPDLECRVDIDFFQVDMYYAAC